MTQLVLRSGSISDQVVTCCLAVPSDYLIQCWLFISKILSQTSQCILVVNNALAINPKCIFENNIFKRVMNFTRGQWVILSAAEASVLDGLWTYLVNKILLQCANFICEMYNTDWWNVQHWNRPKRLKFSSWWCHDIGMLSALVSLCNLSQWIPLTEG